MSARTVREFTATEQKIVNLIMKVMSVTNTWVYRLSGGRIAGRFPSGAPVLLLTTIGRKSGKPRVAPLLYLREGENVILVASKGGMPHHPLWYRNLEANPEVEIEIGREKRKMTARRATDEEKARLWPRLVSMYKSFNDYQARTKRDIPVIILSPR